MQMFLKIADFRNIHKHKIYLIKEIQQSQIFPPDSNISKLSGHFSFSVIHTQKFFGNITEETASILKDILSFPRVISQWYQL